MQPASEQPDDIIKRSADSRTKAVLIAALVLVLVCIGGGGWFLSYVVHPGPELPVNRVTVYIPKGASVQQIAEILSEARIIRADSRFFLLARLSGHSGKLQAGEFSLQTRQKPFDVIRELSTAPPLEHLITIPEGMTIEEVADIFSAVGWINRDLFVELSRDRTFLDALGLNGSSTVEGYLYPDTYKLVRPASDERQLIRRLVKRALQVWQELSSTSGTNELSRQEVFTLASIIEKETAEASERPIIAAVFLNRLKKKMRLQSDPTVIYGMDGFNGRLLRTDLKNPTPYNTYLIPALPPGPICSPGKDALQAVLQPDKNDFLYFVSKNNGTHHFSRSLKEHNRAVRKYQRSKSAP